MTDTDSAASLGPMPLGRAMETIDERTVAAPPAMMFDVARDVEHWPAHLAHYRFVRFREQSPGGLRVVEMSAYRHFGPIGWPTWWLSLMEVLRSGPLSAFATYGVLRKPWT